MRLVIGIDIHRTLGEVVIWEDGLTRHEGRVDMTRTALEDFGRQLLKTDEVVIEATGNRMAVSRLLSPYVERVVIAAIGSIDRFSIPQKPVSCFGLDPRVRQSGPGPAHHGRISKAGRSHARAMLVEAARAAARAPGPLRAFFIRVRARRGHQIAAVAVARKLAALCWPMLAKGEDYRRARPNLVAHKGRAMEPAAGLPQKKGSKRGASFACNVKAMRHQQMEIAEMAQKSYEHFVAAWQAHPASQERRAAPPPGRDWMGCPVALSADTPRFATRSTAPERNS